MLLTVRFNYFPFVTGIFLSDNCTTHRTEPNYSEKITPINILDCFPLHSLCIICCLYSSRLFEKILHILFYLYSVELRYFPIMASFRFISVRFYTVFIVPILMNNFQLEDKTDVFSRMTGSTESEMNMLYYLKQVTTNAIRQTTDAIVYKYRASHILANSGHNEIFLRDCAASASPSR